MMARARLGNRCHERRRRDRASSLATWPAARDADLYKRLSEVIGEGLQVLEHQSLIWARSVGEGFGVGYAPTRRGRAALEANAVERALHWASAESA
jgi:hypothetical protein